MNLSSMLDKRAVQYALRQNPDIVVSVPDGAAFYDAIDVVWSPEANRLIILCGGQAPDFRRLLDEQT